MGIDYVFYLEVLFTPSPDTSSLEASEARRKPPLFTQPDVTQRWPGKALTHRGWAIPTLMRRIDLGRTARFTDFTGWPWRQGQTGNQPEQFDMGQGAEDAGGYEVDYDEYEDCQDGYWVQRDGSRIAISEMSLSHLNNTKRICARLAVTATFTSDAEKWADWVEVFDREISVREVKQRACPKAVKAEKSNPRGVLVEMICHCGFAYKARSADIKRGWGLSCGKRCAAIRRAFGRPAAKRK